MLLSSVIARWKNEGDETWFLDHLEPLVAEMAMFRDYSNHDECEELLWDFIDDIEDGRWSVESQLTFIEYALDASLLLGNRELFQEFMQFEGLIDESAIARHQGTLSFLESLDSIPTLSANLDEIRPHFLNRKQDEDDDRWFSISLVALVDLAQRYFPLSTELPQLLESLFKESFAENSLDWFLDDLKELDPNMSNWLNEREEVVGPIYTQFLGDIEKSPDFDEEGRLSAETIRLQGSHLLDEGGNTLSIPLMIIAAKAIYNANQEKEELWKSLKRGVAILQRSAQLDAYLASYGSKHFAKLNHVLNGLVESNFFGILPSRIVDWGCGQGLGSLAVLEKIPDSSVINEIVLIEPGISALQRAEFLIENHHSWRNRVDAKIISRCSYFENTPFQGRSFRGPTVHIFSNVIDMESVDLQKTKNLICSHFSGPQLFIVVSPFISRLRSARLLSFEQKFSGQSEFQKHFQLDKGFLIKGNATISARTFSCLLGGSE